MKTEIFYKESVEKDLKRIDKIQRIKIIDLIEKELSEGVRGKKLKGRFQDLYSLRVGDYRVIYCLFSQGILILRIRHRKDVYH